MLQRNVSRSWILALAASAALGLIAASLWGAGPALPEGTQPPAKSGHKPLALAKLSATARGERIPEANIAPASHSKITPVAATVSSPSGWIPENLRDPGFDRYVDLAVLCKAWEEKNASALADVALQLREGERILLRPHRGFSSQQLLQEAARIAAAAKDTAALQRLRKIAETMENTELKAKLVSAEKLAGEARATDPALQISISEMTPEVYTELWGYLHAIQGAGLTGDTTILKEIQGNLANNTGIPEKQKKYLQKLLQENQATAAALPEPQKQLGQSLNKLSDSSRGHGGGGGHGGGHGWPTHGGGHGVVVGHGGGHGGWYPGGGSVTVVTPSPDYAEPEPAADNDNTGGGGLWFENLKDQQVNVAIVTNDGNSWIITGWYAVDPGQRVCVVSGDLTNQYYYYYAFNADSRWEGDNYYYVDPQHAFSYDTQDSAAVSNAEQQGYERRGFYQIDTGNNTSYVMRLN
jgi:uncharacterized membrane protein